MTALSQDVSGQSDWDIVVVGAGAAGLSAAIAAATKGARTLLVEKCAGFAGSSTALSGGLIVFAGTDMQKNLGIADSGDQLYVDILRAGHEKNDPVLVRAYVDNQLETYHWLRKLGVAFGGIVKGVGAEIARAHSTKIGRSLYVLRQAAERAGVGFLPRSEARLLCQDADGRVVGVAVESADHQQRLLSSKGGVVLATGGFGADPDMLRLTPIGEMPIKKILPGTHIGTGHRMALKAGGMWRDLAFVKPTFGIHFRGDKATDYFMAMSFGAVIVNQHGVRFVNEALNPKDLGLVVLRQPSGLGIMILDDRIRDHAERALAPIGLSSRMKRRLITSDTIEGLACALQIPCSGLRETIDKYNTYVARGLDSEFGRTNLSGNQGKLVEIDKPPFHAFEATAALAGTYGGIAVDNAMRVVGATGNFIPRLYAAGEIVGGFHGDGYMTGTALGKAFVFGRLAGENAVSW